MVTDGTTGALVAGLLAGVVAGLGVAVPPGAIGLLLVREALTGARGRAAAAVAGVVLADLGYAVLAVLGGAAAVALLDRHGGVLRAAAGLVLLGVAGVGLRRAVRGAEPARVPPATGPAGRGGPDRVRTGPWGAVRTALRFAALAAVNPGTLVPFAAVATALGAPAPGTAGAVAVARSVAFVAGVVVASAGWNGALVVAAGRVASRLGPRAVRATAVVGHGLVAVLALVLVAGAGAGSGGIAGSG